MLKHVLYLRIYVRNICRIIMEFVNNSEQLLIILTFSCHDIENNWFF